MKSSTNILRASELETFKLMITFLKCSQCKNISGIFDVTSIPNKDDEFIFTGSCPSCQKIVDLEVQQVPK